MASGIMPLFFGSGMDEMSGLRKYGLFAKADEDIARCIESIHGGGQWPSWHQCPFKRGFGPTGEYCRKHSPESVKKRQNKVEDNFKARMARLNAPYEAIADLKSEKKRLREYLKKILAGPDTSKMVGLSEEAFYSGIVEYHKDIAREALAEKP